MPETTAAVSVWDLKKLSTCGRLVHLMWTFGTFNVDVWYIPRNVDTKYMICGHARSFDNVAEWVLFSRGKAVFSWKKEKLKRNAR